jgi:hypothetical protein
MDEPRPSVSSKNTSQIIFIGNDKISEIVNDSGSDGGNFNELSDKTCEVNLSISSSEEEKVIQPEPGRGRKRTCRALPKRTGADF